MTVARRTHWRKKGIGFIIPAYSAIPSYARTPIVPSFTRALVKNLLDFEGREYQALSGEWCFWHVRRVYNLLLSTQNLAATWTFSGATQSGGNKIEEDGSTGVHRSIQARTIVTGNTYVVSAEYEAAERTRVVLIFGDGTTTFGKEINLATGTLTDFTGTTAPAAADAEQISSNRWRIWMRVVATNTVGSFQSRICSALDTASYTGTIGSGVYQHTAQLEDVTGQSIQTASEYVSVGVESAPAYHGSMVDGVKTFATDYSGNPLPTSESATYPMRGHHVEGSVANSIIQSNGYTTTWTAIGTAPTKNATGPNGKANYAWTGIDDQAGSYEGLTQVLAVGAGTTRTHSIRVAKKASSPCYPLLQTLYNPSAGRYNGVIINEVAGTIATVSGGAYDAPAIAPKISSYNDDFWTVEVTYTQAGASTNIQNEFYYAGSLDGTTISAAGVGTTVFCDSQDELGTKRSSTINTTTGAVTRPADVPSYTGALIGQIKSLATSFWRPSGVSSVSAVVTLSDNTLTTYAYNYMASATMNGFAGTIASVAQWVQTASNAYTPGTQSKVAWSMATNSIKMDKDGTAQTPDTVATVPAVTQLDIGHIAGSFQINGAVGPTIGYIRLLSQGELAGSDRSS